MRVFAPIWHFAFVLVMAGLASAPGFAANDTASAGNDHPDIQWNDNEDPAGQLEDGRYQVDLEVRRGDWYPLGSDEPALTKLAFAEAGEQPRVPGPMMRVPAGTRVEASVTNTLEVPLEVQGLASRHDPDLDRGRLPPGEPLPWVWIAPGETEDFRFTADQRGTYFYRARLAGDAAPKEEDEETHDSLLTGALIVDPSGGAPAENEKIMVIQGASGYLTMNGRPWPHTERLTYDLGDQVTYRVINDTHITHPMHLHGFFFTVEAQGDMARETVHGPARQQKAVTQTVAPDGTLKLSWSPDRPGGWIFHCHISLDFMPNPEVSENPPKFVERIREELHAETPNLEESAKGMGGMVMGIYVRPPEDWTPAEPEGEPTRLFVRKDATAEEKLTPRYGYALAEPDEAPPEGEVTFPGPPLVLEEGNPAPVRVVNQTDETTTLHWHGLELDSLYDGVIGITGYEDYRSPPVEPGDTYDVLLRTDRPGTYIYHTHVSDIRQQGAGLYGPLLVMPEGEEWDRETDRVYILGGGFGELEELRLVPFLNGTTEPEPAEMTVGTTYRLRFINILLGGEAHFRLARDGFPVEWRPLAQDAWELPNHQRERTAARKELNVGETFDVTYTPEEPGELALQVKLGDQVVEQDIRVVKEEDA
jgi:FtsP/CotA-like multicopper oxidase with cupredoxin domain